MSDNPAPKPALSFPASTFATLLPSSFLNAHLSARSPHKPGQAPPSVRPSGRSPTHFRPPALNTNSLAHTNGSAVVRLGQTSVVAGVSAELLPLASVPNPPRASLRSRPAGDPAPLGPAEGAAVLADLGLVVPNVELSTGCHPSQPTGNAPSALAQSLSQRLLETVHSTKLIPADQLEIWGVRRASRAGADGDDDDDHWDGPGDDDRMMDTDESEAAKGRLLGEEEHVVAYWTLYIDVVVLALDGSPFDAIWAAVLAALSTTALPFSWWHRDQQAVLSDPAPDSHIPLRLSGFPITASFAVFDPRHEAIPIATSSLAASSPESEPADQSEGRLPDGKWLLADPDGLEESVCAEKISVIVDYDTTKGKFKTMGIIRSGGNAGAAIGSPEDVVAAVEQAQQRWTSWKAALSP